MNLRNLSLAERDQVETGICVRCGYSHAPDRRRQLIRHMVGVEDISFWDIAQAWPCFYGVDGRGARAWNSTRGAVRLRLDLRAIRTNQQQSQRSR